MSKVAVGTVVVAGALALAGCGSSSGGSSSGGSSGTGSGSADSGFAQQAPAKIVAAAGAAIRSARSYTLDGTATVDGTATHINLSYAGPGQVSTGLDRNGQQMALRVVNKAYYVRANAAFFGAQGDGAADASVANKWLKVSGGTFKSFGSDLAVASPSALGACLVKEIKDPTPAGTATVDGQSTVAVHYTSVGGGNAEMWVSQSSPHYPVKVANHGSAGAAKHSSAGGAPGCDSSPTDNGAGSISFSQWNSVPPISAPAGAESLR